MAKEMAKLFEDLKRELRQEHKELKSTIERELRGELREVKSSMEFINKTFEEMKDKLNATIKENAELRAENNELRSECKKLYQQTRESESRLVNCEQYSRNRNVEIKGIPPQQNENLLDIVGKLGVVIGAPILETDIEVCHRVPVPNSTAKNIVVQFMRRDRRDNFLGHAKKRRVTCEDLGISSGSSVYVNEHLCPALKKLLGVTVARKKECNWKFVWVRNGSIFARKAEQTPLLKVTCADDVCKITAS